MKRDAEQASRDSFALRLCRTGGRLLTYFLLLQSAVAKPMSMEEKAKARNLLTTPGIWLGPPPTGDYPLACPGDKTVVLPKGTGAITQERRNTLCLWAYQRMRPGEKEINLAELIARKPGL